MMAATEQVLNGQTGVKPIDSGLALEALYERRLQALVNAFSEVIYRANPDWSEMYPFQGNGFITDLETTTRFWLQDYIPPEDHLHVLAAINKAIHKKSIFQLEHRVRLADSSLGWTFSRAIPIMDEKDDIIEWFGVAYDITERKRKEENLALLAEISADIACLTSADEIMRTTGAKVGKYLNITACRFSEINEELDEAEVKYGWHSEGIPDIVGIQKLSTFVTEEFRQDARTGKTVIINNTQTDSRTDAKIYEALDIHSYISVPFHRSKEWKYLFTLTDIKTRNWRLDEIELIKEVSNRIFPCLERAYSEETMRASEEKFRALFERMSEGLSIWEVLYDNAGYPKDFLYLEINKSYEEHTGFKATDIIGKTLLDIAPDLGQSWKDTLAEVAITGKSVEYEKYNQNTERHYETHIFSPKKDQVAILLRDITDRKKLEGELKRQKELFEAVIENMHDALAIFNPTGEVEFMNAETRKMYPHFNDKTTYREVHEGFQYFDLENNVIPKKNLPTARVLNGEKIRNEKILIKRPDRDQYTEINTTPIFDDKSNLTFAVVAHRDISEKIKNQQILTKHQDQIIRSEQEKSETLKAAMKLKDEFLYLITHEFRTPMAVICSALQAIDYICKDDVTERMDRYLKAIKTNTNRQLRLVNNLLDITKINSGNIHLNLSKFDIVYVTKSIAKSIEIYASQKNVDIHFQTNLVKKEIYIDEEKFERILLNLLSNALKFTPLDKSIHVIVTEKKHKKKDFICVSVRDEGIGIPIEMQKEIFERFGQADKSLTRRAEGTGLGLYLVTLLVKAMGGEISVESEEGKGSTFTVLLPALKTAPYNEGNSNKDINKFLLGGENRIIQAISIEFSDIYFD